VISTSFVEEPERTWAKHFPETWLAGTRARSSKRRRWFRDTTLSWSAARQTKGWQGHRSDSTKNWEEKDELVAIRLPPSTEGRLPFIDGPPQLLDSICYIPETVLKYLYVQPPGYLVPITPSWRGSLDVIFDNQINKRKKSNCRLELVTTRSHIFTSHTINNASERACGSLHSTLFVSCEE
jgi:hypothetical protein